MLGILRATSCPNGPTLLDETMTDSANPNEPPELDTRLTRTQAKELSRESELNSLLDRAATLRDEAHGHVISYSRKVFIPLTRLCRDVCHYCTFATTPKNLNQAFLSPDEVLDIARAGQAAGCNEALFTLGDKPEKRYRVAREELAARGHQTVLDYLAEMSALVLSETSLLPHANPGVMNTAELEMLKAVSVSQGIMLESVSERLCEKGGPHYGSPDKHPRVRLETLRLAGELSIPFTTGILIGIGETRQERLDSLFAIRDLHERYGHIQEVIIQNFRAKQGTLMATSPEPTLEDLQWTVAMARLILGGRMNIQAPPNLSPGNLAPLVNAGINDWGGVSPVTPDHVNPEAPWPHLLTLEEQTAACGKSLVERLAVYPEYVQTAEQWFVPKIRSRVLNAADTQGFARSSSWVPGDATVDIDPMSFVRFAAHRDVGCVVRQAVAGDELNEDQIVKLFQARGPDMVTVVEAADSLREEMCGDSVSYVVNRNINYTNVCYFKCGFCAFSKGKTSENLRGKPYDLDLDEIARRAEEAWARGATELCMQGGIHPDYTGKTYLRILGAVKEAVPDAHIHAFSSLEVWQGAKTLGTDVRTFLEQLKAAGLATLPGTAAEVLDDEVRDIICPDKIRTDQWLEVIGTAHSVGLPTTATIMFGHVERYEHWARHLLRVRALQVRTGGITEFVPLPFVPMESPMYRRGNARRGPTYREAILMHAVARLVLHPHISNIQASWVKMGATGVEACLNAGVNDLGGTLMNETITRAAGGEHGQEMEPERMEALVRSLGRRPRQRTTLYGTPPETQLKASFGAAELLPVVNRPAGRHERSERPQELVRFAANPR